MTYDENLALIESHFHALELKSAIHLWCIFALLIQLNNDLDHRTAASQQESSWFKFWLWSPPVEKASSPHASLSYLPLCAHVEGVPFLWPHERWNSVQSHPPIPCYPVLPLLNPSQSHTKLIRPIRLHTLLFGHSELHTVALYFCIYFLKKFLHI